MNSPQKCITFEFVLLDAFSMLSVTAAIEPLRVANRMAGHGCYSWSIVSEDGSPVQASNGMVLDSQDRIGAGGRPDYSFVCAGLSMTAAHPTRLSAFLNRRAAAGVTMGAISMGTIFLARAGLLRNSRCTMHWEGQPAFRDEFPDIALSNAIFEIDGSIVTCAGGMSSFDMVMALIANNHDARLLRSISNQLQMDRTRSGVAVQSAGSEHIADTAPKQLHRAVLILSENMETPVAPLELAEAVGTSRRTLERLFLKYVGMTPSKFCKVQRLERAHDLLLHSNLPLLDIALATGFRSASYFSYAFSGYYGVSPSSLRSV
ncbi:helix-turn-helix domain-containing protein [Epibacterium sp. SM1969]|uniref:Helix-turn-helix domain-containing protein n=1 Tax=Tritonibacter aquimaris TaxID=2663379 RepID=A0A844B0N2_9RHOB|nr:GlxA family transcriptional regulator [Tritonibacter aquimaris]MQY43852.1 helix-turn-helix domain-containing protein [Tritonibacter aquimaris]